MLRSALPWMGLLVLSGPLAAAEPAKALQAALDKPIIGPRQSQLEVQDWCEARVPRMPAVKTAAEWEAIANRLRQDVLDKVVFRGAAAGWRTAPLRVEWQETSAGGPGYRIRKLRYEALPGLWIPALLYEPEKLDGKVPVSLAVNGHDRNGKQAPYKQIRCINMAQRGMIVLNVEWLGMGQLNTPGYGHYRMNQLDLCGTSGLAPFYLNMSRGLDVLLAHKHADPQRVAVSGLSGGGWQTIFISALDTRVTLANPVAGYSSFLTRVRHLKDLGDSEQTPSDLAAYADYNHLTAMMAPRATLLTYNAKDQCCFEAGYALPPLLQAAEPMFKLFGKEKSLRSHVNHDPGDHNFEKDNRQALYRMLGEHFFAGNPKYSPDEIACAEQVKTKDELAVELPAGNADFSTLAQGLAKDLPRHAALPGDKAGAAKWQQERRQQLRQLVKAKDYSVKAEKMESQAQDGVQVTHWKLRVGDSWTVPAVELVRGQPKGTTLLVADAGRKSLAAETERLLTAGQRVLAVDPFYFGESKVEQKDFLFAMLVAAVGERPLGLQASQLTAIARWLQTEQQAGPVTLTAVGPRTSVIALVAGGLEEKAIARVELHGALGSLKELLEQNKAVNEWPEQFCFGLLEAFDLKQLAALCGPRPVTFAGASDRVKTEMAGLKAWYGVLGVEWEAVR